MIHPLFALVGYCVIAIPEEKAALFINGASESGLIYHDMGAADGCRRFRLSPVARVRAGELCEILGIEMTVEREGGLPFLLLKILRRGGIVLGGALMIFCVLTSQRVVWDIRVEGNDTVPEDEITGTLEECGLFVGSSISDLDIDGIENRFLILSDEISWITVNVMGTVAEVEVRERIYEEPSPDYVCSNLVATRNGTVTEFFEVRGNVQVELGEEVSEGQLLVGGIYGSDTEPMRFVRSRGQVLALCERDYEIEVPLEYDKKVYTGEKKIKKSLIFFEKEVKFFGNSGNSYTSCDTIEVVKYFNFFGLGELPFGIRTVTYAEYGTEKASRTEAEAREQSLWLLEKRLSEDAPDAETVKRSIDGRVENGRYVLTASVSTVENIAEEREVEVEIIKGAG